MVKICQNCGLPFDDKINNEDYCELCLKNKKFTLKGNNKEKSKNNVK